MITDRMDALAWLRKQLETDGNDLGNNEADAASLIHHVPGRDRHLGPARSTSFSCPRRCAASARGTTSSSRS